MEVYYWVYIAEEQVRPKGQHLSVTPDLLGAVDAPDARVAGTSDGDVLASSVHLVPARAVPRPDLVSGIAAAKGVRSWTREKGEAAGITGEQEERKGEKRGGGEHNGVGIVDGDAGGSAGHLGPGTVGSVAAPQLLGSVDTDDSAVLTARDLNGSSVHLVPG